MRKIELASVKVCQILASHPQGIEGMMLADGQGFMKVAPAKYVDETGGEQYLPVPVESHPQGGELASI